jgi:hypothetical protein
MSMADLHDLAEKLHDHEERMRSGNFSRPEEFGLLARTLLQAVREMQELDRRLSVLEGSPPQSN